MVAYWSLLDKHLLIWAIFKTTNVQILESGMAGVWSSWLALKIPANTQNPSLDLKWNKEWNAAGETRLR